MLRNKALNQNSVDEALAHARTLAYERARVHPTQLRRHTQRCCFPFSLNEPPQVWRKTAAAFTLFTCCRASMTSTQAPKHVLKPKYNRIHSWFAFCRITYICPICRCTHWLLAGKTVQSLDVISKSAHTHTHSHRRMRRQLCVFYKADLVVSMLGWAYVLRAVQMCGCVTAFDRV